MKQFGYRLQSGGLDISVQHGLPSPELLDDHAGSGVELVLADIDATLTDAHSGDLCSQARDFADNIQDSGLQLALVTNNRDTEYVYSVAEKLSVPNKLVFSPKRTLQHKPMPTMVKEAIRSVDGSPEATFAVGDGATDMISFFASGVRKASVRLNCAEEAKGYWLRHKVRAAEYQLGRQVLKFCTKRGLVTKK